MDAVMGGLPAVAFWAAVAVTLGAGFVKGAIGFAMPMLMISAFSSFLPPEVALAGLILPTLVTNLAQAFRDGPRAAVQAARTYWRFLAATVVFIAVSAQFVRDIPQAAFLMLLGLPITVYAALQLMGGASPSRSPTERGRSGRWAWLQGSTAGCRGSGARRSSST